MSFQHEHAIEDKSQDIHLEQQKHVVVDDVAADYVDPTLHISPEENKRLRRKIYKHLLPIMCLAYITQSLDKGTTGAASIMGWPQDLGMVGQDYALTGTFLWVGVIVGEPIINQFIRKFPVAKVLGLSMVVWSCLVLGLVFSWSPAPVFVIRTLLGFFESSFSPCLVTIQWFTTAEQTNITTIWQAMFGIAGVVANLMAYGFYHVQGYHPLRGWQWFTLTVALISFGVSGRSFGLVIPEASEADTGAAIVLLFLPDTPMQAQWATEDEKKKYVERVRANDQGIKNTKWKGPQAREAFTDPLTWLLVGMILLQTLVVGGLNTFNSLLINKAFGFPTLTALLVSIPLSAFQVCLYFLIAYLGTRTKESCLCMIGYTCVNIIGTIVLLTVAPTDTTKGGLLVAFYFMQCFQSVSPTMFAMVSRNIAGQTKKSIVYALFFVAWAGGNSIGAQLFQSQWAPRYFNSLYIHLGLYAAFIVDVLALRRLLKSRNAKRDAALNGDENLHTRAFEDMTDKVNADFRYSY